MIVLTEITFALSGTDGSLAGTILILSDYFYNFKATIYLYLILKLYMTRMYLVEILDCDKDVYKDIKGL